MSDANYVISKIDNKNYCVSNGQFTKHLRTNQLTYQAYYEKYITGTIKLCSCSKPLTFYQKNHTYASSCGNPVCVGKTIAKSKQLWTDEQKLSDSANKKKAANAKTDKQKELQVARARATFMRKYGVEWSSKFADQKEKSRKTKKEKYGSETYNNSKQTSNAWQAKTLDEISNIVSKRRATCMDRFGVENALMKPEARINSAKSNSIGRAFVMPSGKVVGVRGYEDTVLANLLKEYSESELLFDDRKTIYSLPVFAYINVNLHLATYYPDIYISKENKIIEVKSMWWWNGNGNEKYNSRLINNLRKKDSVIEQGYEYEVWLFKNKTEYEILAWK